MKSIDFELIPILIIWLILSAVLAQITSEIPSANMVEPILALLILIIPQGRILVRLGDLKSFKQTGKQRFFYFITNEFLVFITLILFTLSTLI